MAAMLKKTAQAAENGRFELSKTTSGFEFERAGDFWRNPRRGSQRGPASSCSMKYVAIRV